MTTYPHRWWALAALGVALITIGLDTTVLSVALPELANDLHASTAQLQWFAGAYTLVLAAAVIPAGMIGDRLGPKRLLLGGLALFGAASAMCAFAPSAGMLIVARAILGLAAAVLMPVSMSVLTRIFTPEERGRALAIYTTAMSLGLPLGPVLGGYLLQHFWWGSVFLINIPLVVVGLAALAWALPALPGTWSGRIDLVGVALSSAAMMLLCYGFIQAGEHGFGSDLVVALLALAVICTALLVTHLRRSTHALVDPTLFRSRGYTVGTSLATAVSFIMIGALFFLPQYFQAVLGSDPLRTGIQLLPMIGGLIVGVQVAERLRGRLGSTVVVTAGFLVLAGAVALATRTTAASGYGLAAIWISCVGVGMGMTMPPTMDIALGSLPPARAGIGSGVLQALRQAGSTLGVAVCGTVLNAIYRAHVQTAGLPGPAASAVRDSAAAGVEVAKRSGSSELLASVQHAFTSGMTGALWISLVIALFCAALAARYLPRQAADVATEPPYSKDEHTRV